MKLLQEWTSQILSTYREKLLAALYCIYTTKIINKYRSIPRVDNFKYNNKTEKVTESSIQQPKTQNQNK